MHAKCEKLPLFETHLKIQNQHLMMPVTLCFPHKLVEEEQCTIIYIPGLCVFLKYMILHEKCNVQIPDLSAMCSFKGRHMGEENMQREICENL